MPKPVRYVVQRLEWRATPEGHFLRLPGRTALVSFDTPEAAEAERRKREDEARAKVNPFNCDGPGLHTKTALDEDRLHDWMLDAGLTPPRKTKAGRGWAAWWKKAAPKMTALQRAKAWEAFGRLRFFDVVERPVKPVGYALVRINWEYNDQNFYAEPEGGKVFTVYRSRERAMSELEDYNDVGRDVWEDQDDEGFEDDKRRQVSGDPLHVPRRRRGLSEMKKAAEVEFWEVIEIELEA